MNKIFLKYKWAQLLIGFIIIGIAVVTIILAATNNFTGDPDQDKQLILYFCLIWSISLFVISAIIVALDIVGFRQEPEFGGLIVSGACIGLGLFLLIKRAIVSEILASFLPYVLVSIGGVLLIKTVILAAMKVGVKKWISFFIMSVVFITVGVIFICVPDMLKIIYIIIGVLLVVLGALEIVGFISMVAHARSAKKDGVAVVTSSRRKKKEQEVVEPVHEEYAAISTNDEEPKEEPKDDEIKLIE